jgi:hypothetical protein
VEPDQGEQAAGIHMTPILEPLPAQNVRIAP